MKVLLFIFLLPLVLLARLAALLRPEEAVRPASFRLGALVPLIALPLALLAQPVAAQQQSFFRGTWDCIVLSVPNQLNCVANCSTNPAASSPDDAANGGGYACNIGESKDQCIQSFGIQEGPLCCVGYASLSVCQNAAAGITTPDPGPDPVAPTDPDPTPDPVPPRVPNARADNSGESTKGGALPLIAGGLFLAHYIYRNATGDDGAGLLPEGLELDPHSVISHRNGVSGAQTGLTARYGDWLARISSSHSGESWARPDASLQWSYRSSSWEFRAYAAQSGGAWDRPRAQVEWGWRF